jgi:hypothetical protein
MQHFDLKISRGDHSEELYKWKDAINMALGKFVFEKVNII